MSIIPRRVLIVILFSSSILLAQEIELNKNSTAILIDTISNAYVTHGSFNNCIYFEPFSNALGVVYKKDKTYYSTSTNNGFNWNSVGPLDFLGKYPGILIANPTKSTDPLNSYAIMGWYKHTTDSIQTITVLYNQSTINTSSLLNISSLYFLNAMNIDEQTGNIFMPVITPNEDFYVYTSTDLGASWDSLKIADSSWFNYVNGLMLDFSPDGQKGYIAWNAQPVYNNEYQFGFIKTSDGGMAWDTNPTWIPISNIIGLPSQIGGLNYEVDIIVDCNGDPHFAGTFVDTLDGSNTGIYEVFWNGTDWASKLISLVNNTVFPLPGGLQTLNEVELSRNIAGTNLALKYIDVVTPSDSLTDIFASIYDQSTSTWSFPENITQTPNIMEKFSDLAPRMNDRMHIFYTIFGDSDTNDLAPAEIWYLSDVMVSGIQRTKNSPSGFKLFQNYPNPFNPQTTISYQLYKASNVELSIYNVLGQRISLHVNKKQIAGEYEYTWDGSNISSGVYFYQLKTDESIQRKKMILIR